MSGSAQRRQQSHAARRVGYLVAIAINAVLLYLFNAHPGWRSASFLTPETVQVVGVVNLALWAGIVANCIYFIADPQPLRAFGDLSTSAISLAAMIRVLDVFPFAFHNSIAFMATIVQVVLIIAIAGACIGVLYSAVILIRGLAGGRHATR